MRESSGTNQFTLSLRGSDEYAVKPCQSASTIASNVMVFALPPACSIVWRAVAAIVRPSAWISLRNLGNRRSGCNSLVCRAPGPAWTSAAATNGRRHVHLVFGGDQSGARPR